MIGWIIAAIFIATWIAFAVYGFSKKWSMTSSVGGGLIAAFLTLIPLSLFIPRVDVAQLSRESEQQKEESEPSEPPRLCNQSSLDGSVDGVEEYLRANLNDPQFQSVEWSPVVQRPNGYAVRLKYRARNGFGALVIQNQVFSLDSDCKVRFILEYYQD